MHIPIEAARPDVVKYGALTAFLKAYAADYGARRCKRKTYRMLALEFYGSEERMYVDRIRTSVWRLNNRPVHVIPASSR